VGASLLYVLRGNNAGCRRLLRQIAARARGHQSYVDVSGALTQRYATPDFHPCTGVPERDMTDCGGNAAARKVLIRRVA
jgi:hypothetical protein